MSNNILIKTKSPVNIRSVALPAEHGGWGFLIEPILLGLWVAGTGAGLLLMLSSFGVFLIHQPLKLYIKDRRKKRQTPRTVLAGRFASLYAILAIVPLLILLFTQPLTFIIPIIMGVPFALVQLNYDARNKSRELVPEVCGALALAMIAPSIAILGGWEVLPALILWMILAVRALTAILYIRARLKLERRHTINPYPIWGVHVLAFVSFLILALADLMPYLVSVAFLILLIRAVWGLSAWRKPQPAKVIGFQELGFGVLTVILSGLGFM